MPPATTTSCGRPESSFCQFLALGNMRDSRASSLDRSALSSWEAVKRSDNVSDAGSRLAGSSADLCLSMLRQDADGNTIVDGLGRTLLEQSRDVPGLREQFSRAHENVHAHCRRYRGAGDSKLASRYEALRAYFEECAPNWRSAPKAERD